MLALSLQRKGAAAGPPDEQPSLTSSIAAVHHSFCRDFAPLPASSEPKNPSHQQRIFYFQMYVIAKLDQLRKLPPSCFCLGPPNTKPLFTEPQACVRSAHLRIQLTNLTVPHCTIFDPVTSPSSGPLQGGRSQLLQTQYTTTH